MKVSLVILSLLGASVCACNGRGGSDERRKNLTTTRKIASTSSARAVTTNDGEGQIDVRNNQKLQKTTDDSFTFAPIG